MVVAVVPILGRDLLVPYTLKRLNKIVDRVICVVENHVDRQICADLGAFIVNSYGNPLGKKWNDGFWEAKQFNPDYVLYVGSSDWVSDNWLDVMIPKMGDYDFIGSFGYHLLHIDYTFENSKFYRGERYRFEKDYNLDVIRGDFKSRRLGHWKGYECERKNEPIGIGRVLSRKFLERVKWNPFGDELTKNLDYSMMLKSESVGVLRTDEAQSMAVSTNLWSNKHIFSDEIDKEYTEKDMNDYLTKWFPEGLELF